MSFPLDAEGLDYTQVNNALAMAIGNIGGDRYYLAEPTAQTNWCGFAFLATQKYPCGELLYIDGAGASNAMMQSQLCLIEENVNINAGGYPYDAAYIKRKLVHGQAGTGVEWFSKSDFQQLQTNLSLQEDVEDLKKEVRKFVPEAVGTIKMWASNTMPSEDWQICDGSSLDKTQYAALFAVLGTQFGGAGNLFNLPDFRGKSPFGFMANDPDFGKMDNNPNNEFRGEKTHKLLENELPDFLLSIPIEPTHDNNDHTNYAEPAGADNTPGVVGSQSFSTKYSRGKTTAEYGQPYKTLPPFMAINFIIRIK